MPEKYKLVMIRNGETEHAHRKLLLGWFDADLNEKGRLQAIAAGKSLKKEGYEFDIVYTSVLRRAMSTTKIILQELEQSDIPVEKTWRLNERHFGGITCFSKGECAARYGYPMVLMWRRGYDTAPPPLEKGHPYYESIQQDPKYAEIVKSGEMPTTESLRETMERTLPYFNEVIVPQIKEDKRVLIVAHNHSLRAIVKQLHQASDFDSMEMILPVAIPFVKGLDEDLNVESLVLLGDDELKKEAEEMAAALNPHSAKTRVK